MRTTTKPIILAVMTMAEGQVREELKERECIGCKQWALKWTVRAVWLPGTEFTNVVSRNMMIKS
jgi:hypothetical protein